MAMKEKKYSELLVCEDCGSKDVEVKAWININTNEYCSDVPDCDYWCPQCRNHANVTSYEEYLRRLEE